MEEGRIVHDVFLGLGSNMGDREAILLRACNETERLIGPIVGQSAFIETEPWGYESANKFLNAVVRCHTCLHPLPLLDVTQHIERLLGKCPQHATTRNVGPSSLYHDRPIDIDILLYDCERIDNTRLKVPHPLMKKRDFVMQPLRELLNGEHDETILKFLASV